MAILKGFPASNTVSCDSCLREYICDLCGKNYICAFSPVLHGLPSSTTVSDEFSVCFKCFEKDQGRCAFSSALNKWGDGLCIYSKCREGYTSSELVTMDRIALMERMESKIK